MSVTLYSRFPVAGQRVFSFAHTSRTPPDIFRAFSGERSSGTRSAIMAFITPHSRMCWVTARVSMPQMPGMPCFFRNASSVYWLRKLLGSGHHSRTT